MEYEKYVISYYEQYPISNRINFCIIEASSKEAAIEHFYSTRHGIIVAIDIERNSKG